MAEQKHQLPVTAQVLRPSRLAQRLIELANQEPVWHATLHAAGSRRGPIPVASLWPCESLLPWLLEHAKTRPADLEIPDVLSPATLPFLVEWCLRHAGATTFPVIATDALQNVTPSAIVFGRGSFANVVGYTLPDEPQRASALATDAERVWTLWTPDGKSTAVAVWASLSAMQCVPLERLVYASIGMLKVHCNQDVNELIRQMDVYFGPGTRKPKTALAAAASRASSE